MITAKKRKSLDSSAVRPTARQNWPNGDRVSASRFSVGFTYSLWFRVTKDADFACLDLAETGRVSSRFGFGSARARQVLSTSSADGDASAGADSLYGAAPRVFSRLENRLPLCDR